MPLIRPFAGLRPAPGRAAEVAAPPYDVVSAEEARRLARGRPWSFLHVSRPEIDLPEGTDPYSPAVYRHGAEVLRRMQDERVLLRDPGPRYYLYRLVMGSHTQTGVVAAAAVDAYDSNRIRRHELTRPEKEDDRVRHIDILNAQTGPVFLTCRREAGLAGLVADLAAGPPEVDFTGEDGVRHSLWSVVAPDRIAAIGGLVNGLDGLYIADGHHRSAAASRVAAARRRANPATEASHDYFLAVLFPEEQMQVLDYNRVVRDLGGLSAEEFLRRVGERFGVQSSGGPVSPAGPGEFGLYLSGRWHRLRLDPARIPTADPVARLDVSLLTDHLLQPVLGIADLRRDRRIDFVGGIRGLGELARRVDSGEMAAAFSLFPTRLSELMAVADAGQVMPPKSTWFEPKLADGLVSHVLD